MTLSHQPSYLPNGPTLSLFVFVYLLFFMCVSVCMRVLNVTKDSPEILFGCCTIAFPALSSVSNILRMTDVNKRKSSMKILVR